MATLPTEFEINVELTPHSRALVARLRKAFEAMEAAAEAGVLPLEIREARDAFDAVNELLAIDVVEKSQPPPFPEPPRKPWTVAHFVEGEWRPDGFFAFGTAAIDYAKSQSESFANIPHVVLDAGGFTHSRWCKGTQVDAHGHEVKS